MREIVDSGRNLIALSLVVLGAILLLLSISGLLASWNSVLRLGAVALLGGGVGYILILSRSRLHEWQGVIGTLISGLITISIAIGVTAALTAAMKRTDFFLEFTKRYHAIRADAHDLDNRVKKQLLL